MVEILKIINIGLSFILELVMLAAFGYWGFYGDKSTLLKWALGIGIPVAGSACNLSVEYDHGEFIFTTALFARSNSFILYTVSHLGDRLCRNSSFKSRAYPYLETMVKSYVLKIIYKKSPLELNPNLSIYIHNLTRNLAPFIISCIPHCATG
jgi:hypothetical protein